MSRIRIVIDPGREGRPLSGDLIVESDDDLIQSRLRLRQTLAIDEALTIWVRSTAIADRFADLANDPAVAVEQFDLRAEVANSLGLASLPDIISDDLARRSDLLSPDRRPPRHDGESDLAWCMRVLLGDTWAKASVDEDDLTPVLRDLAGEERPELRTVLQWRLSAWAGTSACRGLWRWLSEDPHTHAACLTNCAAVHGFGEMAVQWVTQAGYSVEMVKQAIGLLDDLQDRQAVRAPHLHPTVEHQLEQELLSRLRLQGPVGVQAALPTSEGAQRAAMTYLVEKARAGELLTLEQSESLLNWTAEAVEDAVARSVATATELLTDRPPPPPLRSDADWPAAAYWLASDYIPFYLSRAVTNRLEETVECVASFERWLVGGYGTLMEDTEAGLQWFCADGLTLSKNAMVVLVLLDGVPSSAVHWLREVLAEDPALSVLSDRMHLAPVPTLTAIDKPVVLSSRLPDQSNNIDVEALSDAFGVSVDSCHPVSSLDQIGILFPAQVILYHYQRVDSELLHRPMAQLERWLHCRRLMEDLARELRGFVGRAVEQGMPLRLGCVSDHGWTELPQSACRIEVPAALIESVSHGRVLKGTADSEQGVAVPRSRFFLRDDYTVARGYSYFVRRPRGAVHGGLTPQEVAVAGLWLTTEPIAATNELILQVAGEVRRAVRHNAVSLHVTNPNLEAAVVSNIQLTGLDILEGALPLEVPAQGMGELRVQCDASGCIDMLQLSGIIYWRTSSGRPVRQEVDFAVPTVGAACSDQAFEDMFR